MPIYKKSLVIDLIEKINEITKEESIRVQHEIINSLKDIKNEECVLNNYKNIASRKSCKVILMNKLSKLMLSR